MDSKSKDFDDILLESIDEALLSLGELARKSVYFYLERNFKVVRSEVPMHLDYFQTGLEKIFGIGARFLEILIMKNLYAKTGCKLTLKSGTHLEFTEYVEAARQNFLDSCLVENDY